MPTLPTVQRVYRGMRKLTTRSYFQTLADVDHPKQAGDYNRVLTAQFTEAENTRPRGRRRQATMADAAGRTVARLCEACDLKQQQIVQDLAAFMPKDEVWHGAMYIYVYFIYMLYIYYA